MTSRKSGHLSDARQAEPKYRPFEHGSEVISLLVRPKSVDQRTARKQALKETAYHAPAAFFCDERFGEFAPLHPPAISNFPIWFLCPFPFARFPPHSFVQADELEFERSRF